jgi:hypothetical protein
MPTWSFDTCECSFEVDHSFNFVKAVHVCDDHIRDYPHRSFTDAHEHNQAINIQKAIDAGEVVEE